MTKHKMSPGKRVVDKFRTWNRSRIARRRLAKDAIMTPHGFKFNGHSGMQDGTFKPEETKLVSQILDSVDTFLNVGANSGYYCCFAQQKKSRQSPLSPYLQT